MSKSANRTGPGAKTEAKLVGNTDNHFERDLCSVFEEVQDVTSLGTLGVS